MARMRSRFAYTPFPMLDEDYESDNRSYGGWPTGNALKDGYTCYGTRPKWPSVGAEFMHPDEAAMEDDRMETMLEYGGRDSIIARRLRDDQV